MPDTAREAWTKYCNEELSLLTPLLTELEYVLDKEQPHLSGERYLMRAVSTASGKKLILLGCEQASGAKVVIKATRDVQGAYELAHERTCRRVLAAIRFAYGVFLSPEEKLFVTRSGFTISIQAFVHQDRPFLARPVAEQFSLVLRAFKAQESAHAATFEQQRLAKKSFGSMDANEYLSAFARFSKGIEGANGTHVGLFARAEEALRKGSGALEQYGSFLTHTDFVPHNFRVLDGALYLLDHSSLRFGNKYEGWARFLNYMTLYNPALADALENYVRDNRTPEEHESLRLMRLYRLGEIIWYYTNALTESDGDLRTLNEARIGFWSNVLEAVLDNHPLAPGIIEAYTKVRDQLRSDGERRRQEAIA